MHYSALRTRILLEVAGVLQKIARDLDNCNLAYTSVRKHGKIYSKKLF